MAPDRPKKSRKQLICRCRLYCTTLNPITGRFEGDGKVVSAQTRTRHKRDDRLAALLKVPTPDIAPDQDQASTDSRWAELIQAELSVLQQLPSTSPTTLLRFRTNPDAFVGTYRSEWPDDVRYSIPTPNTGPHSLVPWDFVNIPYLQKENRLWELYQLLADFRDVDITEALRQEVYVCLQEMDREKEIQWNAQIRTATSMPQFNTDIFFRLVRPSNPTVHAAYIANLVLQHVSLTSRRAAAIQLGGLRDVMASEDSLSIPKDPRTLTSRFHLDPITKTFIVCPACHCLFPFDPTLRPAQSLSLPRCTYRKTPTSEVCGEDLWKTQNVGPYHRHSVPRKKYIHQDLMSWLGRLLCRPGMEEYLENPGKSSGEKIDDIWSASLFQTLKDQTGAPFFPGDGTELRLIFSLSVDGFDPFGSKAGKQSAASTGQWMVLLNLPRHLRYCPENMYLAGVIPGPSKPSNDQINHYTQLLVDDMKVFWTTGVRFSRTAKHREGRDARAMVVPLVCDLLGARQVIGYPGTPTAHYTCTACDLDHDDLNLLDPQDWPRKNLEEVRRFAFLHRDADSEAHQKAYFEGTGWRWSPLWELEYWNPMEFTVIDSMHSLDLNLTAHHCRTLFRIDTTKPSGTAMRKPLPSHDNLVDEDLNEFYNCQKTISDNPSNLLMQLLRFHRRVLFTFCVKYDIKLQGLKTICGTRWVLAKAIYLWRSAPDSLSFQRFRDDFSQLHDGSVDTLQAQASTTVQDAAVEVAKVDSNLKLPEPGTLRSLSQLCLELPQPGSEPYSKLYSRLTADILAHFCDTVSLKRDHVSLKTRGAKKILMESLCAELQNNEESRDALSTFFGNQDQIAPAAFLGADVMAEVWKDMGATKLPSWVTPVPKDWGTTRRGKLSADNWRVISSIHLPITLIRLFGDESGRKRDLVDNFMDLVQAIRIATMRDSSQEQVEQYNRLIFRYSRDVKRLYPEYSVLPSHHGALHIGEMITAFGPKHAHDSPHYERYIKFFHRELEGTYLRTSGRYANILALMKDDPEVARIASNLIEKVQEIGDERARGFNLAELCAPKEVDEAGFETGETDQLGELLFSMLAERLQSMPSERNTRVLNRVVFTDTISYRHNTYGTSHSRQYRDSYIVYRRQGQTHAGEIQAIFSHHHVTSQGVSRVGHYLVMEEYRRIEGTSYERYGMAGGFCCESDRRGRTPALITLQEIICHAAVTELESFTHILPVNRDMLLTEIEMLPSRED